MRTLFLFPTQGEATAFQSLCPDALVAIIGVGMAEAGASAAEAVAQYAPQRVVLAGVAGALGEKLQVGECVAVVKDSIVALPKAYRVEYESSVWGDLKPAIAYTVNRTGESLPLADSGEGDSPAIEQMEGAAVAAVCRRVGVEFLHLRSISNRVADARDKWRMPQAIEALTSTLVKMYDKL